MSGSNGQRPTPLARPEEVQHVAVEIVDERPVPDEQPRRPSQQTPAQLRDAEPDIVDYLFRSHERIERQVATIELPDFQVPQFDDDGKLILEQGQPKLGPWSIRVRALHQEQIQEAERRARRVRRQNERSGKVEMVADLTELASWLIYLGTVPEDRQKPGGWDDKRMWARFEAANGVDLIDRMLKAGDKNRIADAIRKLSNIQMEDELVGESSSAAGAS